MMRSRRWNRRWVRWAAVLLGAVVATAGVVATPRPAVAAPAVSYVQGQAVSTARVASTVATLGQPVAAGDLLVGWFAEYNAAGNTQVSDDVNGAWTRAPSATAFADDSGDIALYYVANTKAAPGGVHVTIAASAPAYLEASIGEYAGLAVSGPLDQISSSRGVGTAVDSGATGAVAAGELVFSGVVTGGNPQSVTPGATQGAPYTARAQTGSGAAYSQDVLSSAAGAQHGTATLAASTDWYAVAATFRVATPGDTQPPTAPTGLAATSVAASSVSLSWSASTDNVAVTGYDVYRGGTLVGKTSSTTTTYTDSTVAPSTSYVYTVDAVDGAGNHSPQTAGVPVTTPRSSARFVQGSGNSPGTRATSATLALTQPVAAGDLLVGWVAQYDATGTVTVSDPVNGAWTRSGASEHFTSGGGDIALYYVQNTKAASAGLTVTLSAGTATYLPGVIGEYTGVAATAALDQSAVALGKGTAVDSGNTAAVASGELLVGAVITGGQPLSVTPGSSQGAPLSLVAYNGSRSTDLASALSVPPGAQHAPFTLGNATDWYAVAATFRPGP